LSASSATEARVAASATLGRVQVGVEVLQAQQVRVASRRFVRRRAHPVHGDARHSAQPVHSGPSVPHRRGIIRRKAAQTARNCRRKAGAIGQ
jgi:hypothetical protein